MMVSFVLSFFPRDVLDEILNLIESVSEDFPSYSLSYDVAVIQWITSCNKSHMTTRVITLWREYVTSLTTPVSTMRLSLEILPILNAMKSNL